MKLSLGFSPCPNDCFVFDALVHGKVDTEGLAFETRLEDVETLNQMATNQVLDISKLSFHAYAFVQQHYILLRSGSALGFNCGPLLIFKKENVALKEKPVDEWKVAIPGKLTTANFLLSLAYPSISKKQEMLFSEIEQAVLNNKVDAGLIIHESRFTYQDKGLEKIIDLGEFWDKLIHAPIPLGGIAVKRTMDKVMQQKVNRVIRRSVEYAFGHPNASSIYVRAHAQEMSEAVMKKHIQLYVNQFSVDLGETGSRAIELMFDKAAEMGVAAHSALPLIID